MQNSYCDHRNFDSVNYHVICETRRHFPRSFFARKVLITMQAYDNFTCCKFLNHGAFQECAIVIDAKFTHSALLIQRYEEIEALGLENIGKQFQHLRKKIVFRICWETILLSWKQIYFPPPCLQWLVKRETFKRSLPKSRLFKARSALNLG